MLGKLLSKCLSSTGGKALRGNDGKFESLYGSLASGIARLDGLLGAEPVPRFSIQWMQLAMEFIQFLHSAVFLLVEQTWRPARETPGIVDMVDTYTDMSRKLLDMCNYIKQGIDQLESCQMSLDLCLSTLVSGIEILAVPQHSTSLPDSAISKVASCVGQLERMQGRTCRNLWAEMLAKLDQSGKSRRSEKLVHLLQRSHSVLPSTSHHHNSSSDSKKAADLSAVIMDVQVVASFFSCLVLWALTDPSERFRFAYQVDGSIANLTAQSWAASLLRLNERMVSSSSKPKESSKGSLALVEVREVLDSIRELAGKMEVGLKLQQPEDGDGGGERGVRAMAESAKAKLEKIREAVQTLSMQTTETFSAIIQCRKRVLDAVVDSQLPRAVTI